MNKTDLFLASCAKYLPYERMNEVKNKVESLSDECLTYANASMFKDPTVAIILSAILGTIGFDRFYVGDVGLGVLKLITLGGVGIWYIVDIFLIMRRAKRKNFETLLQL